jgi:RimJ/RimL family protein N-acetyltransferase
MARAAGLRIVHDGDMLLPTWPQLRDGEDLVLRRPRSEDLEAMVEQCSDAEMARWTRVPSPYSRADAEQFLAQVTDRWDAGTGAGLAVEVDGRYAGSVGLSFDEGNWAEIGYGLAPWARGQGIMTRAARTAIGWGFDELGLEGIRWRAIVGNVPSRRVAEQCGITVEGTVRGIVLHGSVHHDGWIGSLLPGELISSDRR